MSKKTVTLIAITTAARCSEIASTDTRYISSQHTTRFLKSATLNLEEEGYETYRIIQIRRMLPHLSRIYFWYILKHHERIEVN